MASYFLPTSDLVESLLPISAFSCELSGLVRTGKAGKGTGTPETPFIPFKEERGVGGGGGGYWEAAGARLAVERQLPPVLIPGGGAFYCVIASSCPCLKYFDFGYEDGRFSLVHLICDNIEPNFLFCAVHSTC